MYIYNKYIYKQLINRKQNQVLNLTDLFYGYFPTCMLWASIPGLLSLSTLSSPCSDYLKREPVGTIVLPSSVLLFFHQMLKKHPRYSEHTALAQAVTMNGVEGRWGKMPQRVTHLLPSWGLELHLWSTWWKERTDTHKLYSDFHAHKGNSSSRAHVQKHIPPQTPNTQISVVIKKKRIKHTYSQWVYLHLIYVGRWWVKHRSWPFLSKEGQLEGQKKL